MTTTDYLLVVLMEECAEVAQRASKAIRFGLGEVQPGQSDDNRPRLERELADLIATADYLGLKASDADRHAKIKKLEEFMGHSRKLGKLEV